MIEATFTDISDWQKNIHYSTGGTRRKYVALHPDNNEAYFFKGSKETPEGGIRYSKEFWSEIVSSKIGAFLGFPLLDYNIGYDKNDKQQIGCLSKTMITSSLNKLTEGITYLTGANPSYNPEKDKKDYTFQFICDALKQYNLEDFIQNIIEIIVFDAVIGNSDRHQENWGIITSYRLFNVNELAKDERSKTSALQKFTKLFNAKTKIGEINFDDQNKPAIKYRFELNYKFAPIYDSGCCLGREHTDEKVSKFIQDSQMLDAYVRKGESEIHWLGIGKKSKHFDLLELLSKEYPAETKKYLQKVKDGYNKEAIGNIIYNIDKNLPKELISFKLSDDRKEMMLKLVTLRIEKLVKLL